MQPIASNQPASKPGTAQAAATNGGQGQAVQRLSFLRSTRSHTEVGQTYTGTLATADQTINIAVPVNGYLRVILLRMVFTTASNIATTAFNADAPWNVIRNLNFKDANGNSFMNMGGYSMFLASLFGAYRLFRPDGAAAGYSVTTGAGGGVGGSFTITLPIFCEFAREGFGALPNMDATTQYRIDLTLSTIATVYSTAPTNAPTFTITPVILTFQQPSSIDEMNLAQTVTPPALGTYQIWTSSTYGLSGGENTITLNSATGNAIRNQIFIFRNAGTTRDDTYVPTSNLTYEFDAGTMWLEPPAIRRTLAYMLYGVDAPAGVLVYNRTSDPDFVPIGEYGEEYLVTKSGTKLLLRFTPGATPAANSTIEVLTNHVIRAEGMYNAYGYPG